MKKILLGMVLAIFLFSGTAFGMGDKWFYDENEPTGVSECAIQVIKKIVVNDEYDWVVARFNPAVRIAAQSACTVEAGTTNFLSSDDEFFYLNGGVTMNPTQFGMNKVLSYWFSEEADAGTEGTAGNSNYFKYEWISAGGSGNTNWKVKVFYPANAAGHWTELTATAGGSIYVGPTTSFADWLGTGATTSPVYSTSTTFYPTYYVGWGSGVTPIINVIGKK